MSNCSSDEMLARTFSAMSRASSLCKLRISRRSRSYSSAQRWRSAWASTNCAVTRPRFPERDTEPRRTPRLSSLSIHDPNRARLHVCIYASVEHRRPPVGPACLQVRMLFTTDVYHRDNQPEVVPFHAISFNL